MPDDAVQLDYAPPPPGARGSMRRWLTIALIGVAVIAAVRWVPDVTSRLRFRWAQARCDTFAYPPGTVVYDSDPANRAALLRDAANYVALDDTSAWLAPAVGRREPAPWADLKSLLFGDLRFWPPGPPTPKAMLHRLRNATGQERFVAIVIAPDVPGRSSRFGWSPAPDAGEPPRRHRTLGLVSAIVRPGDWENPPAWEGNGTFLSGAFDPTRRLRFYAGQVDPQNPARFSIGYEIDGQPGTIDGTFQVNGDVVMSVRDGPAKVEMPPP